MQSHLRYRVAEGMPDFSRVAYAGGATYGPQEIDFLVRLINEMRFMGYHHNHMGVSRMGTLYSEGVIHTPNSDQGIVITILRSKPRTERVTCQFYLEGRLRQSDQI